MLFKFFILIVTGILSHSNLFGNIEVISCKGNIHIIGAFSLKSLDVCQRKNLNYGDLIQMNQDSILKIKLSSKKSKSKTLEFNGQTIIRLSPQLIKETSGKTTFLENTQKFLKQFNDDNTPQEYSFWSDAWNQDMMMSVNNFWLDEQKKFNEFNKSKEPNSVYLQKKHKKIKWIYPYKNMSFLSSGDELQVNLSWQKTSSIKEYYVFIWQSNQPRGVPVITTQDNNASHNFSAFKGHFIQVMSSDMNYQSNVLKISGKKWTEFTFIQSQDSLEIPLDKFLNKKSPVNHANYYSDHSSIDVVFSGQIDKGFEADFHIDSKIIKLTSLKPSKKVKLSLGCTTYEISMYFKDKLIKQLADQRICIKKTSDFRGNSSRHHIFQ